MNESSQAIQNDEISLRELYLILKRGLPLIVAVAVLAGLIAFAMTLAQPDRYEAESTVLINPSPVRVQGPSNLTFSPPNDVSYEAYQTLAESRPVLEAAVARVPEAGLTGDALRRSGRLVRLLGPQRPDQIAPLSVAHVVQHTDPAMAAALADAWAESTLETVRSALLESLSPVDAATAAELARLEAELAAVEARWRAFQAQDDGELLTALYRGTSNQLAEGEAQLAELERQIAAAQAKQALLRDRLAGSDLGSATAQGLLAQLQLAEAVQGEQPLLAAQLEALLERLAQDPNPQLYEWTVAILDLTEYQRAVVALVAAQAEHEVLAAQQRQLQAYAAELRERLAALNEQRSRLERELFRARAAYNDVAALQPIITYVTELAPTNARLLSRASVPVEPVGPRRLLATALAAVIAALLALVYVFLREAVATPKATPAGEASRPRSQARTSAP